MIKLASKIFKFMRTVKYFATLNSSQVLQYFRWNTKIATSYRLLNQM